VKRLAIITTHPIQYNAPFFKLLTERGKVQLRVFYTWPQAIEGFDDPDFGQQIRWDIPLMKGYDWEAVDNASKKPSSKYWGGIDCPGLNETVEAFNPDAVMIYGWNLKSHFRAMRYFKGRVPIWFTGDSTLLDEKSGLKKIMRRIWLTWVYRHIDKAFYVGTNNKTYFKAHGIREEQLVFFPHAVDNERFYDNEERQYEKKAQQWRKELGYKEDDMVILFAGKLEPKKNPLLLIDVLKLVHQSTDLPIYLLFVGNGPLEPELKAKSKHLNYVKFLPFQNQSDMPVVYRLGNVFCLPSKGPGETWGLAVNEALACGRAIIVSDQVGCAVDLIEKEKMGSIFESNDIRDLSVVLLDCVNNRVSSDKEMLNLIKKWSFENKCWSIEMTMKELGQNE
jgi:glycosyltransferase involved in cell wall biosynthesis